MKHICNGINTLIFYSQLSRGKINNTMSVIDSATINQTYALWDEPA
jgi:hypothetical protein